MGVDKFGRSNESHLIGRLKTSLIRKHMNTKTELPKTFNNDIYQGRIESNEEEWLTTTLVPARTTVVSNVINNEIINLEAGFWRITTIGNCAEPVILRIVFVGSGGIYIDKKVSEGSFDVYNVIQVQPAWNLKIEIKRETTNTGLACNTTFLVLLEKI